jgi:catechol 2,3-dioxygenase-like lactoylglutathione lyase family enzyme
MWDCVTVRVSDIAVSRRFYETVLGDDGFHDFRIEEGEPVTQRLHIAFLADTRDEVDAFWRAGVGAGYESDGEPGPRPQYSPDYYGAFLLDPDGNSVEKVHHGERREGPNRIDHLWIRVADLEAQKRFWQALVPRLGLRITNERPERFHVAGRGRSFALVQDGEPTANVHLAFPAVEAFTLHDPDGNTVEAVQR